jgi:hypothetical protein
MEWTTIGPWTYALGSFATIKGCGGLSPWAVYVDGKLYGSYHSLGVARLIIENAAIAAGHEVVR